MSSLTCYPTSGTDDVRVSRSGATYPPTGTPVVDTTNGPYASKNKNANYSTSCGFERFDTAALPDGAVITAAHLHIYNANVYDDDSRSLNVEWYSSSNWPIDGGDHTESVGTTAAQVALSGIPWFNWVDIELSNLSNINKAGFTGIRIGISGGEPTGDNSSVWADYDYDAGYTPQIVITYTTGYSKKVLGCLPTAIAKILGVSTANIAKVNGV